MAVKLGELLLSEKLITPEQLDEALKSQVIFGIKLGSSLIEHGFITDEQLCAVLSRKLGVPAVSRRLLLAARKDVLGQIPAELAGKHRVIPIKIEGKKLALAMADPTDIKAVDEVAFVSGCIVYPFIAPDVYITEALSRFYEIRGDIRYVMFEGDVAVKRTHSRRAKEDQKPQKIEFQVTSSSGELLNIEIPMEFEGFANLPCDEMNDTAGIERYTVDQLSKDLAAATNREQVADAFIRYLGQEFTTVALFILRNNMAVGWKGVSSRKRLEELETFGLSLDRPSAMKGVFETGQHFAGVFDHSPENSQLLRVLGSAAGTALLVLPLAMQKKIVAAAVISSGEDDPGKRLEELQKLVYKASLAFEMLIIRNKILMT